jgi:hypothetical protein
VKRDEKSSRTCSVANSAARNMHEHSRFFAVQALHCFYAGTAVITVPLTQLCRSLTIFFNLKIK